MPALPIPELTAPYAKLLPASANGRLPSDTWALTRTLSALWLHLLIQYFNYLWGHYCRQALFWVPGDSSEQNRPHSCAHSAYLISVCGGVSLTKPFLVNPCILGIDGGDQNTAVPQ